MKRKCEDEKREEDLDKAEGRNCTVSNGDRQMAWIEKRGNGIYVKSVTVERWRMWSIG